MEGRGGQVPLEEDEEIEANLSQGVTTHIKFKAVSEIQPSGKKEVFFGACCMMLFRLSPPLECHCVILHTKVLCCSYPSQFSGDLYEAPWCGNLTTCQSCFSDILSSSYSSHDSLHRRTLLVSCACN